MTERLLCALRTVLALVLLGVGPVTRAADALLYHTSDLPAAAVTQIDDGSAILPHGDACLIAVASAPATPAMAYGGLLILTSDTDLAEAPPAGAPVVLRATGPPPSRAPPA
jgi:hypothetical protein